MDEKTILDLMKMFFKTHMPEVDQDALAQTCVPKVLEASIDIVEFLLFLEEKLGVEEEIDLEKLGPKFTQNMTFAELAGEVRRYLETR